jgi:dTDP-4-dehydrorhamnose reductase
MSGIYHVTASGRTSWYGFAAEILRGREGVAALRPIPSAAYPSPAQRPKNSLLDNAKLNQVFGIALPDWKIGLQLCLEEISNAKDSG